MKWRVFLLDVWMKGGLGGGEKEGGNFGYSGVCVEMEGQRCRG